MRARRAERNPLAPDGGMAMMMWRIETGEYWRGFVVCVAMALIIFLVHHASDRWLPED